VHDRFHGLLERVDEIRSRPGEESNASMSPAPFDISLLTPISAADAEVINAAFRYIPDDLVRPSFIAALEAMLTEFFPPEYETLHELVLEGRTERAKGEEERFQVVLDQSEITIGRRKENDVQVRDVFASGKHAMIYRRNGRYYLADLKSANKTRLRGKTVKPGHDVEIHDGDEIRLGNTTIIVRMRTKRLLKSVLSIHCRRIEQYLFRHWRERIPPIAALVRIALPPLERRAVVELDNELCMGLYERLLYGVGATSRLHRRLTEIEEGVVKFILLKALDTISREMGPDAKICPRLVDLTRTVDMLGEDFHDEEAIAVLSFHITLGQRATYARLGLPVKLLEEQGLVSGPQAFSGSQRAKQFLHRRLGKYADIRLQLPVWLGTIGLTSDDLELIKPGDSILLDDIDCRFEQNLLSGTGVIFLGSPDDGAFRVQVGCTEDGELALELGDFLQRGEYRMTSEQQEPERIEGEEAIDLSETAKLIIQQATVPVAVELGRLRMSLAEVIRLRKGQILPLGKEPTDLVDLVLAEDQRIVARGKLINMEGKFGVQLVEVLS